MLITDSKVKGELLKHLIFHLTNSNAQRYLANDDIKHRKAGNPQVCEAGSTEHLAFLFEKYLKIS